VSKKRSKGPRFVPVEDLPGPGLGPRGRELVALTLMGLCLFGLLSLATFDPSSLDAEGIPRGGFRNLGGVVGYALASGFTFVLGASAWLLFVAGGVSGVLYFQGRSIEKPILKVLGVVVFAAMTSILLAGPYGDADPTRWLPYGPGGRFGANLSPKLYAAFGGSGRLLILMFGMLCSLLLATEWLVSQLFVAGVDLFEKGARRVRLPRLAFAGLAGGIERPTAEESGPVTGRSGGAVGASVDSEEEAAEEEEEERPRRRRRRRAAAAEVVEEEVVAEASGDAEEEPASDEGTEGIDLELDAADPDDSEQDGDSGEVDPESAADDVEEPEASADADDQESKVEADEEEVPTRAAARKAARKRRRRSRAKHPELPLMSPYPFPPLSLFREVPEIEPGNTQKVLDENSAAIEQRLASFKIDAKVVAASVGPAVTQYEVSLGEGVRVGKIVQFEPDLAAALRSVSVRVVAPIPGKDTVGIEVPNKRRQMVLMRELLDRFGSSPDMAIPLFLGKDVAGAPIVEDLARMPHLLIAGTTGSGKSVCINVILLSILMTRTPQQVRLILIDPKMVELQSYKQIPHLACDVVTNMKKAPAVLEWAVEEMERRYEMLSKVGTTNIANFNAMGQAKIEERLERPIEPADAQLSYIVLVIDEFADLMASAQKDVEESIQRLAQKSRAVGLHVILATQRPSANVITGVIKANLPAQIAFKVSRKLDSRVILDANGAEKLLGHGDMLFVSTSKNQLIRAQGAYVTEDEVHSVVAHIAENGPQPGVIPALVQTETAQKRGFAQKDDQYEAAVEVILSQQRGSATLIQRALSVGYTRATRLLEMMEEDGLVGPFCGSKSRDVLMTVEEWQEREAAMEAELASIDEEDEFEDEEEFEEEDVALGSAASGAEELAALVGDDAEEDDAEEDEAEADEAEEVVSGPVGTLEDTAEVGDGSDLAHGDDDEESEAEDLDAETLAASDEDDRDDEELAAELEDAGEDEPDDEALEDDELSYEDEVALEDDEDADAEDESDAVWGYAEEDSAESTLEDGEPEGDAERRSE